MELFYGSFLQREKSGTHYIYVPDHMIEIAGFKYYDQIYCHTIVPNYILSKKVNYLETDDIQICFSPFSDEEFKNLGYFSMDVPNIPGSFAIFLKYFEKRGIDIKQIHAIDSVQNRGGRVEFIGEIDRLKRNLTSEESKPIKTHTENDQNDENNLEGLVKQLNNSLINDRDFRKKFFEFHKQYIDSDNEVVEKLKKGVISGQPPIQKEFVDLYENSLWIKHKEKVRIRPKSIPKKLKESRSEQELNSDQILFYKLPIKFNLDEINNKIDEILKAKEIFVGISYISEGNYIHCMFKNPEEKILPFTITLYDDKPGVLQKVIKPLGNEIRVNLRLILPEKYGTPAKYTIYCNIENTILNHYNSICIKKLLKELFLKTLKRVSISVDKEFNKYHYDNKKCDDLNEFYKKEESYQKGAELIHRKFILNKAKEEVDIFINCETDCTLTSCKILENWDQSLYDLKNFYKTIHIGNNITNHSDNLEKCILDFLGEVKRETGNCKEHFSTIRENIQDFIKENEDFLKEKPEKLDPPRGEKDEDTPDSSTGEDKPKTDLHTQKEQIRNKVNKTSM